MKYIIYRPGPFILDIRSDDAPRYDEDVLDVSFNDSTYDPSDYIKHLDY